MATRAARMTGLKKPRPLRTTTDTEMVQKLENLNLVYTNDNDSKHIHQEENNNQSALAQSYTAIIDIKGEKLVLASSNMKLILKTASIISLHMEGEILHLDGETVGPNLESGDNMRNMRAPQEKSTKKTYRPTREQLKPHLPDRGIETLTQFFEEPQVRNEDAHCHESMKESRTANCHQYNIKDLLMMSRSPLSKITPRNWSLIRDAFPELVAHEERYFDPFDLKGCSPHALFHSA